jgi:hypothetical protein
VRDHQGALAVGQQLLEHDDLADGLVTLGDDDVERLVEHNLLAGLELVQVDVGADVDPHLAAAGEDVGGVVLARGEEDAETGWRLCQPVDLLLERHDLVAGLAQRRCQALILTADRRE